MGKQGLQRGVSIIGAAYSHMGVQATTPELKDFSERELAATAALEAMDDAGITGQDVDAFVLGHCGPNFYAKAMSEAPFFADWFGMHGKPGWLHDEACATSVFGTQQAVAMVASGMYECVMAVNVGINTTAPLASRPPFLRAPIDNDFFWEGMYYTVEPAYDKPGNAGVGEAEAAIMGYLKQYGYSFDDYDRMMVDYLKNQNTNVLNNPKNHMSQSFEEMAKDMDCDSVDEFLLSDIFNPRVGSILRSRYLGLACDGSAAVIVCSDEFAKAHSLKTPIRITGMGAATNVIRDWGEYPMSAAKKSNGEAMGMAGITGADIDYMAIHDCCGAELILDCEQVGYLEPGQGIHAASQGRLAPDGDKPINTSGGRLQLGHPAAGALGIEIAEAVHQMRGECGPRQIDKLPKTTLISCYGAGFSEAALVLQTM